MLIKVIALQFYRNNANMFFLVLVLAGGFMRSQDHIALATYFIGSRYFLIIPFTVWVVYASYFLSVINKILLSDENLFLKHFILLPRPFQRRELMSATFLLLLPAHLYGFFLIAIAAKERQLESIAVIFIVSIVIFLYCISAFKKELLKTADRKNISNLWRRINAQVTRRYWWISVAGAVRNQFVAIAGFKIFNVLLTIACIGICRSESYDLRMPAIFMVVMSALNITFIVQHHYFQNKNFSIYRSMPLTLLQRFLQSGWIVLFFSLPETVILLRDIPSLFSVSSAITLTMFELSIGWLFASFLYTKDRQPEKTMPFIYIYSIAIFFLVLSGAPLPGIIVINLITAWFLFRKYYYLFEYEDEV